MRSLGSSASRVLKSTYLFWWYNVKIAKSESIRVAKHGRCCIREDGDICVVRTNRVSMPDWWCCAGLSDDRVQKRSTSHTSPIKPRISWSLRTWFGARNSNTEALSSSISQWVLLLTEFCRFLVKGCMWLCDGLMDSSPYQNVK